jgi:hypothetical protein
MSIKKMQFLKEKTKLEFMGTYEKLCIYLFIAISSRFQMIF